MLSNHATNRYERIYSSIEVTVNCENSLERQCTWLDHWKQWHRRRS